MTYNIKKAAGLIFDINCIAKKIQRKDEKLIVFVTEYIKPRINKMAYGLRKKGYHVVLVYDRRTVTPAGGDRKYYSKLCGYDSLTEGFLYILKYHPLVYHVFTEAGSSEMAEYLIRNKARVGKIVFDEYDVYQGLARNRSNRLMRREKYCLENADGLCCRSLETQYLKKEFHYRFKGRRILFFDYCWNNIQLPVLETKREEAELRIVYGGRVLPPESPDILGQTEWAAMKKLVDSLEGMNVKFILIPVFMKPLQEYQELFSYAGAHREFRIENTMKFRELIRYESQCDYGIDSLECQSEYSEYLKKKQETDYAAKARYYATNKYFDYLDAGIPIIYGRPAELFGRMFERYGAAIPCATEKIYTIVDRLRKGRSQYKKHVAEAREKLSVSGQIPRLIKFYHEL